MEDVTGVVVRFLNPTLLGKSWEYSIPALVYGTLSEVSYVLDYMAPSLSVNRP